MTVNMKLFKYSAMLTTLIQAMLVYADDGSANQPLYELPVITVIGTRTHHDELTTPASIYKIAPPATNKNINVNLSEVLQGVPGLQVNNRENYAQDLQISMRGFGARSTFGVRGIHLYVDGIPATMPDGQGQTSNIDLDTLGHIEVLTGPFSSLYGNSSGGAILASSREGQGRPSIQVGFDGGSHEKQHSNIILQGGSTQANEPAYIVSSSYFDTDGYREHSGAQKILNNAKLTWNLTDGSKINWVVNSVQIYADDPAGLTRADWQENPKQEAAILKPYNVRKNIDQTQTGVTWTKPLDDHNELYAMTYFGNRSVVQYQSIPASAQTNPTSAGGVIDFDRNYYGADVRWIGKQYLPNVTFIAGLALDRMDEDRKGYNNFNGLNPTNVGQYGVKGALRLDSTNTLWNLDPYLQASWQFFPTWRINAGLRYSNVHIQSQDNYIVSGNGDDSGSVDYQKLLPSIALGWDVLPKLFAYMSYGKGFETPTFTEMSYPTVGTSGINFALKPASSNTVEWGLKSKNDLGFFTFALFQTKTQNDIVAAAANNGRSTYRNADQTLRQGAEFSFQKKLWHDLMLRASYSYIDATFDASVPATSTTTFIAKGNDIPGIAKNQAFVSLGWQPAQGFQAGLDTRRMDKIFVNDVNSDSAPTYTLVAANIGYVWISQDWKLTSFARIDNLFNRNYIGSVIINDSNQRYFEPADRRNFSVGAHVTKSF